MPLTPIFEVSLKYILFLKLFKHYNLSLVEEIKEWNVTKNCGNGKGSGQFENSSRYPVMTRNGNTQRHIFSIKIGLLIVFFYFSIENQPKTKCEGSIFENKSDFRIFTQ